MFGSFDRQSISSVVMYHFRNGKEFSFKVTELKFPGFGIPLDTHVHETFGTPEKKGDKI